MTAAGGTSIAVRIDHTSEADVRALVTRVEKEQKRLDVLTLSVAGEDPTFGEAWRAPLAKLDVDAGLALMRQAVFSHVATVKHAAALMKKTRNGLIVEVTEGDTLVGGYSLMHELARSPARSSSPGGTASSTPTAIARTGAPTSRRSRARRTTAG